VTKDEFKRLIVGNMRKQIAMRFLLATYPHSQNGTFTQADMQQIWRDIFDDFETELEQQYLRYFSEDGRVPKGGEVPCA
jgi:hypothetical protein